MAGIHWAAPPPATGDSSPAAAAGNEFIDGLTEGPGSREAAEKMRNAGNTLKTLAQNGKFSVNEAGFQAYAKACTFFLGGFNNMHDDLQFLAQAAAMELARKNYRESDNENAISFIELSKKLDSQ